MLARAQIVDVLISEGVAEVVAWHIAMELNPAFLETMDLAAVRRSVDNIIWEHMERTGELEPEFAAPA